MDASNLQLLISIPGQSNKPIQKIKYFASRDFFISTCSD
jgi:hypothetical protein